MKHEKQYYAWTMENSKSFAKLKKDITRPAFEIFRELKTKTPDELRQAIQIHALTEKDDAQLYLKDQCAQYLGLVHYRHPATNEVVMLLSPTLATLMEIIQSSQDKDDVAIYSEILNVFKEKLRLHYAVVPEYIGELETNTNYIQYNRIN